MSLEEPGDALAKESRVEHGSALEAARNAALDFQKLEISQSALVVTAMAR